MPEPDAVPLARHPWAVRVPWLAAYAAALLTAVLFTVLTWVWLATVVPAEVLEVSPAQVALTVGAVVGVLLLLLGPPVGWLVTGLLRRVPNQGLHVAAFAALGAAVGALAGTLFGPDLVSMFGATMGISAGLARLAVVPFTRTD